MLDHGVLGLLLQRQEARLMDDGAVFTEHGVLLRSRQELLAGLGQVLSEDLVS